MFEKNVIKWFNKNIATIESVLKWLWNMQHYYVQESFSKGKLQILTCNFAIIEPNRIVFHFLKMRISFSAFEKVQCSKLIVTFSLRRNGNFICENLRIQTFNPFLFWSKCIYNYIWILIDILHIELLKVFFLRVSNTSEKNYGPVSLNHESFTLVLWFIKLCNNVVFMPPCWWQIFRSIDTMILRMLTPFFILKITTK